MYHHEKWIRQADGTEWNLTKDGKYKITRLLDGQSLLQRRRLEDQAGPLWVWLTDEAGKPREFDTLPEVEEELRKIKIQELFDKWLEVQKRYSGPQSVGSVECHISEDLEILEALGHAGCSQIPGEPFDVAFLVNDRQRVRREIGKRLEHL